MEILRVENLSFTYQSSDEQVLDNVSFSVEKGEFIVLCGKSGCGKTTLLRLLKPELAPIGKKTGDVRCASDSSKIGFVMQNPNAQTVTDKVWHELAFGLENMGIPQEEMRRRVAETASFFGISNLFRQKTETLSGGQKQLLALAAITAMRPEILILDEPTGQLDPISAAEFISTLKKLNRELGITVIAAEHRLEEAFSVADRVIIMDGGRAELIKRPEEVAASLLKIKEDHPMIKSLPSATKIAISLGEKDDLPLTVRDGKKFLESRFEKTSATLPEKEYVHSDKKAAQLKNVRFRYKKDLPDVLRDVSLSVFEKEVFCLLGDNGSGKTTALNVLSGLSKPYGGKVFINGKQISEYKGNSLYRKNLAYLPQDPQTVFIRDTVRKDMEELLSATDTPEKEFSSAIEKVTKLTGTEKFLDRHPFDLSGGETQKCAIAKILLSEPKILLLDEPTKGLDAFSKDELKELILKLKNENVTVIAVTHDVEFAAEVADRCAFLFDGEIISSSVPSEFFSGNDFYTTAANRIARDFVKNAVTCDEVANFFEAKI